MDPSFHVVLCQIAILPCKDLSDQPNFFHLLLSSLGDREWTAASADRSGTQCGLQHVTCWHVRALQVSNIGCNKKDLMQKVEHFKWGCRQRIYLVWDNFCFQRKLSSFDACASRDMESYSGNRSFRMSLNQRLATTAQAKSRTDGALKGRFRYVCMTES